MRAVGSLAFQPSGGEGAGEPEEGHLFSRRVPSIEGLKGHWSSGRVPSVEALFCTALALLSHGQLCSHIRPSCPLTGSRLSRSTIREGDSSKLRRLLVLVLGPRVLSAEAEKPVKGHCSPFCLPVSGAGASGGPVLPRPGPHWVLRVPGGLSNPSSSLAFMI